MGYQVSRDGLHLKLLRVRAGVRPTRLARSLGITPALLRDWEDGHQPISQRQRQRLLEALDQLTLTDLCETVSNDHV
jgi:DNA-binding transcriptional regulator YiaG